MNSVLERLRKRKRAAAACLLPLLAAVWLSSAGACAAMPAAGGEVTAAGEAMDAAARDEHSAHGGHTTHAGDVHAVPRAEETGSHDHATSGGEPRKHGACPHCPAESGGAPAQAEHVACAAIEDASDANRAPSSVWDAKPAAVAILVGDLLPLELAPDSVVDRYGGVFRSSVPLHLYNCVFLI